MYGDASQRTQLEQHKLYQNHFSCTTCVCTGCLCRVISVQLPALKLPKAHKIKVGCFLVSLKFSSCQTNYAADGSAHSDDSNRRLVKAMKRTLRLSPVSVLTLHSWYNTISVLLSQFCCWQYRCLPLRTPADSVRCVPGFSVDNLYCCFLRHVRLPAAPLARQAYKKET